MLKDHLPLAVNQYAGPLILAAIAILLFQLNMDTLALDRTDLAEHEYWRLVTGHLAHTNLYHLAMNLGGIVFLWMLHGDDYTLVSYLVISLVCAVLVSLLLLVMAQSVSWYVGLSGVLHGIFAWGITQDLTARRHVGYLLAFGLVAKLLIENKFGAAARTEQLIGVPVITDAHLYGAAAGSLAGAFSVRMKTPSNTIDETL